MGGWNAASNGVCFCAVLLRTAGILPAQQAPPAPPPPDQTLSPDQLNDLVAPIALYPDPLLSQVMVAATYPLEVVQAFQWVQKNPAYAVSGERAAEPGASSAATVTAGRATAGRAVRQSRGSAHRSAGAEARGRRRHGHCRRGASR